VEGYSIIVEIIKNAHERVSGTHQHTI